MCPEVADEANPLLLVLMALALLLLGLKGPTLLCCVGSFCDEVAPAGSVGGKRYPGLSADVEVF